ncbi:MAG: carboxypeptidase-like regulatory domain-containing protein [Bacteroidota bacterium]
MRKLALAVLLQFFLASVYSQGEFITISGRIVDAETQEPLSFATLNIQYSAKGVVANEAGEFEFTFQKEHLSDTIVFSMTGYQTEKALAQSLSVDKRNTIELVSKEVMLAEVVVTDKKLTALEILELAKKNIKSNYPTKPFEFQAFYRDYKQENGTCISIFEAAISVYDKGYSKVADRYVLKEKVVLDQVRKSLSVDYQTHAFKRINVIKENLTLNDVRYQSRALSKRRAKDYEYELAGYEIINDRLMYKIKAKDDWKYYIYVDVVTYAIPRIEMDFKWIEGTDENTWTLGDTIRYYQTTATLLMDFQLIDNLHYPKYCGFTTQLEASDPESDSLLFTSYLKQELMVTDIDFNPEEKPEKSYRMDPYLMIEQQEFTYDPEFWKNYNVLKLHPRDERLIQGLEERMKLEKQFQATNQ